MGRALSPCWQATRRGVTPGIGVGVSLVEESADQPTTEAVTLVSRERPPDVFGDLLSDAILPGEVVYCVDEIVTNVSKYE